MDQAEFERLLEELRVVKTDHQFAEAKTARDSLPETTHETLSAFANAPGGKFILGLDEAGGKFVVTGVENTAQMLQSFQSLCAEMEPPLRPVISIIEHEGKAVIIADIPAVAPHLRPCHRKSLGEYAGSFIRVGDADQSWTRAEVDESRATRSAQSDYSARPTSPALALDAAAFDEFAARARRVERNAELDDETLKRRYGVSTTEAALTIAGALALGDSPERELGPARIAYKVIGASGAPPGSRFQGDRAEGTIGELLDQVMEMFERDLRTFQVSKNGEVRDELEVPRDALREIVSNALMHRSFSPEQEARPVSIEITPEAVVVMSPGSLFSGADLARLGLDGVGGTRNPSLVRICDFVRTPKGNRIVENHASGIATADLACREAGAMPPLFIDRPAMFHTVLLRRSTDPSAATELLASRGMTVTSELVRLVAVTALLEDARATTAGIPLASVVMDSRFGARALAPANEEDAAHLLRILEEGRVLQRRVVRNLPFWGIHDGLRTPESTSTASSEPGKAVAPTAEPKSAIKRGDRLIPLLQAVEAAGADGLTSGEIGKAIEVASPTARTNWINKAQDGKWIVANSDNLFDRTRTFTLTKAGQRMLKAQRDKRSGSRKAGER